MERVIVIGSSGSGKTTLSRELARRTGLPLIHLDQVFWHENWVKADNAEFDEKLAKLLAEPRWILDGNYGRTLDRRIARADTVIYLDYSRVVCTASAFIRQLTHRGIQRADMPAGCVESVDWEFLKNTWDFSKTRRTEYHKKLGSASHAKVYIFKNRRQARRFLESLP